MEPLILSAILAETELEGMPMVGTSDAHPLRSGSGVANYLEWLFRPIRDAYVVPKIRGRTAA